MNRTLIGKSMRDNLKIELAKAHAEVWAFMLLRIDLPDVFEAAIVKTEVTN
jgi:hypothetical protein